MLDMEPTWHVENCTSKMIGVGFGTRLLRTKDSSTWPDQESNFEDWIEVGKQGAPRHLEYRAYNEGWGNQTVFLPFIYPCFYSPYLYKVIKNQSSMNGVMGASSFTYYI